MKLINNWLSRHKNPMSFWLHMLGIPAGFVVTPVLLVLKYWILAAIFFVAGYALQIIGHLVEGNRSGEEMFFRRLLRIENKKD